MLSVEHFDKSTQPSSEMIEDQVALLMQHPALRPSKRLVSFLQYVVRQTLNGYADQLKKRTIGLEVFNRDPDYDTGSDHIVRTAASELRKRLAVYYDDAAHRDELRIEIPPGSYVPQFKLPKPDKSTETNLVEAGLSPLDRPPLEIGIQRKPSFPFRRWLVIASLSAL